MKDDGVMPSGSCCIVRAERNAVVAKQYFISRSPALTDPSSEQKGRMKQNESFFFTPFSCKQPMFSGEYHLMTAK